jgi:mannose-6-phosphate isomerase-like protein (cupin superfamily)
MLDGQHFRFAGTRLEAFVAHDGRGHVQAARVVHARARGGAGFIDLVVVPPGCSIGTHTHGEDEEIYVVIDGCGRMVVDGASVPVGTGDVVVNRPGGTHGLENTGEEPLRLVVVDIAVSTGRQG